MQQALTRSASLRAPRDAGSPGAGRRAETRRQICAAANERFAQEGFAAVTMDVIARAASIRRSTLYTHFADKEQILSAIGADYIVGVREVIRSLEGPAPSDRVIAVWIAEFAAFVAARPGPAELMMAVGRQIDVPVASREFGAAMMRAYAERLPAFATALRAADSFVFAWALATMSEVGAAAIFHARHDGEVAAQARLDVAAMLLGRFLRQER